MTDTAPLLTEVLEPHHVRVIRLAMGYRSNREVAIELGMKETTVLYHWRRIMEALPECGSRDEVLRLALSQGLIPEL